MEVFGDGTDPTSTFPGNSSNNGTTYTLKWSLTNGGCTSTDDVIVVFFSPPTVSAGADKATCAGSTATMAGTRGGSATSATWTTSGNGTFSNATSNTAVYTPSANDIAAGSVTLTYTTNDPTGPCGPVSDQMTLTINPAPTTAVAGADQSICASSTSLAANSPTSGAGSWSIISGNGGVLDDASSPTSTFSGVQGNSYILRWTISNGGCTSSTDDVSITLKAAPSSVSALPVTATICNGDGLNLTASATGVQTITSGSDEFNGTLNYVVSGGTPTGAAAIFTQRASGYNPLLTGGTPFTTFDGGNFMSVGSIALIGNSQVTSTLTSPVINTNNYSSLTLSYRHVYLKGTEANVNVQASTDGGTTWANIKTYSASVGTPASFAVESFTLPAAYLNQSNLKIKFNYAGPSCNCNAWWAIDNVILNGTPIPLFSWTSDNSGADGLPAGSGAFSSANANITVHPTSSTTYTLAAESGLTSCPASTTATSTVTVNQKSGDPTEATASTNPICSGGSADLTLNGGGGGTGEVIRWYTDALCTQLLPGQSGSGNGFTVIPTTTTTYWGRYEDPAPCNYNSPAQSVTLAVNTAPAITMQPTNQTTTYGTPASFSVVATGTPAPTYQWEVNVGDGSGFFPIDDATSATFSIDQPTVDLSGFLFHVIVTNSCSTVVSDDVSLTVNPLAITITADAQSKTYGDVDPELTAQVTTGTIVNGDEPSGSLARDEGEDVGSYVINQGTYTYGSNYSETYVPANLTINTLAVSVTADAQSKTYGDVDPALTFVSSPAVGTVLANGQTISFTGSLARDAGEDVGSYAINQSTLDNSNYTITYTGANLTINTLAVWVTADAKSKTYGDVDPALTYVSSPAVGTVLANGQTISFTGSLIRDAGETVVGSPYAINQGSVDNSNYAITYTGANLTINALAVSVTADAKSKTYGDVDPALTFVSSPAVGTVLANGQSISFTGSLARDAGEDVGSYAINQNTVDNSNYAITYTGANLTINTLAVSVTADAQSKTYGDVDPALTYVSSPAVGTVLANGQTISFTGSLARDAGEDVGSYAINQGTLDNSNYTITYTGANLTINTLAVSVTADAKSKTYGNVDPALTFVSSPAVGTVLANGQTISFTGSLIRDAGETVVGSPYAINQGSVDNSNYAITYTGANLTINKLAVSVTADAKSKTYGDVDPALTFVSSPAVGTVLANGQTIGFTGSLARDAGEDVGSYAINQGTVDNSNYTITYTGANLTINPLAVSVTADAQSKTYGDVDPALTYVSSPAVGTVQANWKNISFNASLASDAGEDVGSNSNNQGTVNNSNYEITYTGANLTIKTLPVSVTADAKSKTYGNVDPALTYVTSPAVGTVLANGQTIGFTGSLTRVAGENVGSYAINQGSVNNSNYAITYTGANLTIWTLAVSVTAYAKSKTYGDVDPALTYVSSPAVGTVLADGQTIGFTGSLTRVAGENVGSYAINQGTVNNSNYTITYTGANLTITPLSVTVTAAAKSKTYGNVDPALTYVTSPAVGTVLANGQTIGFTGSLTRVAGDNVGSYAITLGTVGNSNYTITYTGANLTITPLSVTVTATAKTKVYGDSDPAFTFTSSPVTGSALPNGITISFTGSLTRVAGETVAGSPYQIQQGSINNPNYNISYVPANLTITQRAVTITADAKSKVYGTIDPPLTYHITTGSLAFTDGFTGSLTRVAGENPGTYKINQGTVSLNSNYKLTYVSALLTISKASVTPVITVTPNTQQYSDLETFTVTIPGGAPSVPGASNAAQSATFKVGTQEMGTASFTVSGTNLVATLKTPLIEAGCTVKGQMAPGTKTVTAVINKPNANYTLGTVQTTTLTITKENATVTYAGLTYFPTSCSTATIALSAIISDYNDGYPGDISNAKVTFHKGSTTGPVLGTASVCVVPLNILNPTSGVAATIFTYTLSAADLTNKGVTFDVYAVVDNYYTGDNNGSPGVITIATRGTDVVAGGGSLSITNSSGTYAGTSGTKTNFGYTAKYAKNGASTTGQVDIVFYSNNKTYQIKSTAISSITVSGQTANFSSKATLTDITNSTSPISIASNLDLLVDMNDVCISGLSDEVSFQLKNGSAVLFSSNWVSSKTTRKVISCGNIEVKNGSICSSGASYVSAVTLPEPASFSVSVLNNPSEGTSEFTLMVKGGDANKKVEMRVVNMAGQQVYETEGATNQILQVWFTVCIGDVYSTGYTRQATKIVEGDKRERIISNIQLS